MILHFPDIHAYLLGNLLRGLNIISETTENVIEYECAVVSERP